VQAGAVGHSDIVDHRMGRADGDAADPRHSPRRRHVRRRAEDKHVGQQASRVAASLGT